MGVKTIIIHYYIMIINHKTLFEECYQDIYGPESFNEEAYEEHQYIYVQYAYTRSPELFHSCMEEKADKILSEQAEESATVEDQE